MHGRYTKYLIAMAIAFTSGCSNLSEERSVSGNGMFESAWKIGEHEKTVNYRITQTGDDITRPDSAPRYVICTNSGSYNCVEPTAKTRVDRLSSLDGKDDQSQESDLFPDVSLKSDEPYTASPDLKNESEKTSKEKTEASLKQVRQVKSDGVPPENMKSLSFINFKFNSSDLLQLQKYKIDIMYPDIEKEKNIWIVGFTDNIGSPDYNNQLALRRADAVRKYLQTKGYASGKIKISGHGKCCYLKENISGANRTTNRRVEIFVENDAFTTRMRELGVTVSPRPST